ncbi:MAG: ribosome small subunit-dependent GTPase A [Desulfuromonadales bacterium]|jgi:ribosome biogenesis GTPase|nr:ribosome small subunit-dependent GTPase A [Desulfuromonadales bacterium]
MPETNSSLPELGWNHFFQQQLSLEELETTTPVRVFALNRHLVDVWGGRGRQQFALPHSWLRYPIEDLPTVGDWLLIDSEGQPLRLLERTSLFKRMASGRDARVQLMAANVDTLFIVTSCNADFNLSRLERYLAMALDAGVEPVVVLTKVDLVDDVEEFRARARTLRRDLAVEAVNSKDPDVVEVLKPWCRQGQTVALVGSSGVGKSTLVNTLSTAEVQETGATREGDAKGRHTTTSRSLHVLPVGGLLLDTPGLRELQLDDCEAGVATLFEEIEAVAQNCRFNDCRHQGEAGCAVAEAAENDELDPRRLANYLKLIAEQERAAETLVEKRRKDKNLGKMYKKVQAQKRREKS